MSEPELNLPAGTVKRADAMLASVKCGASQQVRETQGKAAAGGAPRPDGHDRPGSNDGILYAEMDPVRYEPMHQAIEKHADKARRADIRGGTPPEETRTVRQRRADALFELITGRDALSLQPLPGGKAFPAPPAGAGPDRTADRRPPSTTAATPNPSRTRLLNCRETGNPLRELRRFLYAGRPNRACPARTPWTRQNPLGW